MQYQSQKLFGLQGAKLAEGNRANTSYYLEMFRVQKVDKSRIELLSRFKYIPCLYYTLGAYIKLSVSISNDLEGNI